MKYLKTYEGLFDFFKKKKKEEPILNDDTEFLEKHLEEVRSCFLELNDQNINLSVVQSSIGNGNIIVELWKDEPKDNSFFTNSLDPSFMKLEDLMETFRFADSYLTELGLKINRYELTIFGDYDGETYMGGIYYDSIRELELDLDKEGTKHIESVLIRISKI
jgi:hypothetical protein